MRRRIVVAFLVAMSLLALATSVQSDTGATVTITDSGFVPEIITVPIRSVVSWTNTGLLSHTVVALQGEFSSGVIQPGGVYTYLFAAPGEYPYRDLFSSATGKIVVGEGIFRVYLPLAMRDFGEGQ